MIMLGPILSIAGRVAVAAIFLMSAVGNKIPKFQETVNYMASEGVPMPEVMLVGAIAFLVVGSLSVMTGYKIQTGALLLLIFLALATFYFHDFWNMVSEADRQQQQIQFMKNLSMAGILLFFIANGAGSGKLDSSRKKKR